MFIFAEKKLNMKFDLITENGNLWAVRYDNCLDNVLDTLFGQWNDVVRLRSFFKENIRSCLNFFTNEK